MRFLNFAAPYLNYMELCEHTGRLNNDNNLGMSENALQYTFPEVTWIVVLRLINM